MAFQVLSTNLLQSAIKAAAQVTAALIQVGDEGAKDDPQGTLNAISEEIFAQLQEVADADNEKLREEEKSSGGGGSRKGGTRKGGGRKGGGGSVESDGSMEMTWGAFEGESIADIYEMDAETCSDFGYGDGDKNGRQYVTWLSKNKDNEYVAKRAKAFLDAKRDAA